MWDRAYHLLFGDASRIVATIAAVVVWHLLFRAWRAPGKGERGSLGPPLRHDVDWLAEGPTPPASQAPGDDPFRRLRLAHRDGRYEEAAEIGLTLLRDRPLRPSDEADVRRRLADALDGLGRSDEAELQLRLAGAALEGAPRDPSWAFQLGRVCAARRDFAGACRASEVGLEVAPPGPGGMRALLARALANDLFMAGRMEESARRAEEAVELAGSPEEALPAHRQAAASYSSLGRLDDGEEHARWAVELAEDWADEKTLSDCLGFLAEFLRKRGRLAEALDAVDRAEAKSRPTRETEVMRSEILRSLGRFDESLAALDRATDLDPPAMPRHERFLRGVHSFGRANLLLFLGRIDEAAAQLEAARAGIGDDARVGAWCDASDVHLAALRGLRDEATRGLDRVEARLVDFAQDRGTRSAVLAGLGRAALALGEFDRTVGYWEQYLDLPAVPVDVPTAHYHLAEARRGLGDGDAARDHYQAAVATGLETHFARLAESRLRTLPT